MMINRTGRIVLLLLAIELQLNRSANNCMHDAPKVKILLSDGPCADQKQVNDDSIDPRFHFKSKIINLMLASK